MPLPRNTGRDSADALASAIQGNRSVFESFASFRELLRQPVSGHPGDLTVQLLTPVASTGGEITWTGGDSSDTTNAVIGRGETVLPRSAVIITDPVGDEPASISIRSDLIDGSITADRLSSGSLSAISANIGTPAPRLFWDTDLIPGAEFAVTEFNPTIADISIMPPPGVRPAPSINVPPAEDTSALMGRLPLRPERTGKIESNVSSQIAGMELEPGVAVAIVNGRAMECATKNADGTTNPAWAGVVDPFLTTMLVTGQVFWMMVRESARVDEAATRAPVRATTTRVVLNGENLYATNIENTPTGDVAEVTLQGRHRITPGQNLQIGTQNYRVISTRSSSAQTVVTCRLLPSRVERDFPLEFLIGDAHYRATTIGMNNTGTLRIESPEFVELDLDNNHLVVPGGLYGGTYSITSLMASPFSHDTTIEARRVEAQDRRRAEETAVETAQRINASRGPVPASDVINADQIMAMMRSMRRAGTEPQTLVMSPYAYREMIQARAITPDRFGNGNHTFMGIPVEVTGELPPNTPYYVRSSRLRGSSVRDFVMGPNVSESVETPIQYLVATRRTLLNGTRYEVGQPYQTRSLRDAENLIRTGNWVYGRTPVAQPARPRFTDDPPDDGEDQ